MMETCKWNWYKYPGKTYAKVECKTYDKRFFPDGVQNFDYCPYCGRKVEAKVTEKTSHEYDHDSLVTVKNPCYGCICHNSCCCCRRGSAYWARKPKLEYITVERKYTNFFTYRTLMDVGKLPPEDNNFVR